MNSRLFVAFDLSPGMFPQLQTWLQSLFPGACTHAWGCLIEFWKQTLEQEQGPSMPGATMGLGDVKSS